MSEPRGIGCGATIRVFLVGALLGAVVGGTVCGVLTRLGADSLHYHIRYLKERRAVEPVLQKDPAFKAVEIDEYSAGGILLSGSVPSDSDKKRLEDAVARAIGEYRVCDVVGVWVEKKPLTEPIPETPPKAVIQDGHHARR
jgi:hypothetical protein